ncbi:MAG: chromate efflux transporter [Pyrinomonadaceae bacterium]|nr:chromate efflux transporter [Pyrinomonadaceae bacterium]
MDDSEEQEGRASTKDEPGRASLGELAILFLRLGTTAFGGPAAHIAMMEDAVVRRRLWLSREKFLDLLGATNLIPGPNSTELAIHIGHRQRGWPGLIVAGSCFILPAALIVTAFAWAYVRYGSLPQTAHILYGVKPIIIAVVLQALWSLGRSAAKTKFLAGVGLVALLLSFLRVNELMVLFGAGLLVAVSHWIISRKREGKSLLQSLIIPAPSVALFQATAPAGSAAVGFGLWPLFLFFLKVGSVLFGSGYVLLAFLRGDLVERWHWLTNEQLLDAIAVGQVTPGPVFTTATFIGYVLAGPKGAALATLGIFLPAFIFVAVSGPLVPRIRRSPTAGAFLDGVNVASLALMIVVTFELGRSALVDALTIVLALVSALLLIRYRVNSAWLVLGGAFIGFLASQAGF